MSQKLKIYSIGIVSSLLVLTWLVLAVTNTRYEMVNYYWQAGLAAAAICFGIFGLTTAKHWSWLKSGVGQGVFLISLGLIMWGLGQAGWTYAVIKDPTYQTPPSHLIDILYSSSIPLWAFGMLRLSKATGAKYGLRGTGAKLGVVELIAVMFILSYYVLVQVARGGSAYFHSSDAVTIFFDLWYAAGDVVNLTLALAIFGLSWKYLGGMFKRPVLMILFGFAVIYLADFMFSFYDGKSQYYNGHWIDLLYVAMLAVFTVGLVLLDPSSPQPRPAAQPVAGAEPSAEPQADASSMPEQPQSNAVNPPAPDPAAPDPAQPTNTDTGGSQ